MVKILEYAINALFTLCIERSKYAETLVLASSVTPCSHVNKIYKLRSVQNTGTCYPGQGWFVRNLGWGRGVPDKSSRGLGSMSRYSAQILICFIAYIFLIFFFIPLWVWLGTLQDCQYAQCHLPLSIVIRMRLVFRQSKLPACLAEVQLADQNTLRQSQPGENDR